MKTIVSLFCLPLLLLSVFTSELKADSCYPTVCCPAPCCVDPCCDSSWFDVNLRVAAFVPSDKRVRKVYSKAWTDVQIELNKTFCGDWGAWINTQFTTDKGHSYGYGRHSTRIDLVPLSFGLKYNFSLADSFNLYVGAGPAYSWLRIRDHYEYVHEHTKKGAWGGLFKLGLQYGCSESWTVEIFTDYLVQKFKFSSSQSSPYVERNDVKMNALIAGVGLGWRF